MSSIAKKIKKVVKVINKNSIKSGFRYIKNNGIRGLFSTTINYIRFGKSVLDEYAAWMTNNEPSKEKLEKQKNYVSDLNLKFGIVISEGNELLESSLKNQTYSKYDVIKKNNNYKELLNTDSDFLIFVGDDITFADFALYESMIALEYNYANMFYSDNDYIIENKRANPMFKPDFAPDTILSKNYIGNFVGIKVDFLKKHPEILENLEDDIYYDLILKIAEQTDLICHINKVLYHINGENKINIDSQKKIIKNHLERINREYISIEDGDYLGNYKINYKLKENPLVSIVIPTMDHIDDLEKLLNSMKDSTYDNYEVVIVENNSKNPETFEYYDKIQNEDKKIRVEKFEIDHFNYSKIVNYGVEKSKGKFVVLLNNDIEILDKDWIEQMLVYCQRDDVGICGAKLLFDDESIQHAGVTIGVRGLAGHRCRELRPEEYKDEYNINIVQNLSAVTAACFMVSKELYEKVLGFDEKLAIAFNDVDFCLKIRQLNLLIVYNPFVYGYHYESKSRGTDTQSEEKQRRFAREFGLFVKRWQSVIGKGDPYYNKNWRLDTDLPLINYNKIKYQ